jgi:DNA-binding NtrC family response regulator
VLQERSFERVGSSEPVEVNVRVIAATHQPLEELVRQGRFREDLFYRLNVIGLRTPSLRERPDDVPTLALKFTAASAERSRKRIVGIEEQALAALTDYPWPGNVRELENVIERAVVLSSGSVLTIADFPAAIADFAEGELGDAALVRTKTGAEVAAPRTDGWTRSSLDRRADPLASSGSSPAFARGTGVASDIPVSADRGRDAARLHADGVHADESAPPLVPAPWHPAGPPHMAVVARGSASSAPPPEVANDGAGIRGEASAPLAADSTLTRDMEAVERARLIEALEATGGNRSRAAARLRIPRTTLISKLKKHGL